MFHFLKMVLLLPSNILCLLGLLVFSLLINREGTEMISKSFLARRSRYALAAIPILTIGFLYASFLPAAYGMSSGPPERTSIIPIYITVLSFTVRGNALGPISKSRKINSFTGHLFFAYAPKIALVSLLVLVITKTNLAIQSQSDQAKFVMNWGQVDRSIWQAKKMAKSLLQLSMFQA